MQEDFHYYATYCAAYIAGYSHKESMDICYAAQMVDLLTATYLKKIRGPVVAATTQSQIELANVTADLLGLQNVTRIWSSFHFLPYDLYAKLPKRPRYYMNKYRLICRPNGDLVEKTVKLAKNKSLQAAGIAMHVLADTWAHSYFVGTPSRVINNTNYYFYEVLEDKESKENTDNTDNLENIENSKNSGNIIERQISFRHNPKAPDNVNEGIYSGSVSQEDEHSIMNLGHGRAGHLPDYSFVKYKYLPAWGDYEVIVKDNPHDYYYAFSQMVYALQYLRGTRDEFIKENYGMDVIKPWEEKIKTIISKRQINASKDWKEFGECLSGQMIDDFDLNKYQEEYVSAEKDEKDSTFLGAFIISAMAQKSMVTHEIFKSGNMLAGFSVEYDLKHFKGMKDFKKLINYNAGGNNNG